MSEMSREEAIKVLYSDRIAYKEFEEAIEIAVKALKEQRPHGEWIRDEYRDRNFFCSECDMIGVDYYNFCPNCGAQMGLGEDEPHGS